MWPWSSHVESPNPNPNPNPNWRSLNVSMELSYGELQQSLFNDQGSGGIQESKSINSLGGLDTSLGTLGGLTPGCTIFGPAMRQQMVEAGIPPAFS